MTAGQRRARLGALALLLLGLALPLAACGKKGDPVAPPGEPNIYPRTYPRE
jgi:predicted small lipoprotein YifL